MSVTVVIGNGYGDEGKGHMVNWFCRGRDAEVVRFCGGAQAGHTVVIGRKRHVFHHFGSGTLVGASTYLSRFFASDPMYFLKEKAQLDALGVDTTRVAVHPLSPVVTPYDVLLNQLREKARENSRTKRHGSCGFGFGEAMKREEETMFKLRVTDLEHRSILMARLDMVEQHVRKEIAAIRFLSSEEEDKVVDDINTARQMFWESVEPFMRSVKIRDYLSKKELVFEGSQGLLLDRDIGTFPHVTRSKTGLVNVHKILGDEAFRKAQVVYVTRCYTTKHGAGPLEGEAINAKPPRFSDETNVHNEWQGNIRFAPLNVQLLLWARRYAQSEVPELDKPVHTAVTCLDQVDDFGSLMHQLRPQYVSYGPDEGDINNL